MDYKNTLNLPQTGFPMKADLVVREPERLRRWQTAALYQEIQKRREGAESFVLHDGPPFANGDVHVGTALNKILKDMVVRFKSLSGFRAPYVPGWDCHGLPIEFKVSQEMRKAGDTASDPATIRKACDEYARRYIDLQREQFKRLGVLGDWENPYLTLDRGYEAEELRLFARIVEKGFVYRGKKPVYWSIPCRTALAEAEVEYQEHVSQSVYVKFPVVGRPGMFVPIWTTTPWTLPANLAVAYHPTFSYSLVMAGEESYILSTMLLEQVAKKAGWEGYQIVRSLDADILRQIEYQHPFCARTGKLFPAEFVTNDTGTGFVHIAPGHGADDYHLGRQQGLPIYSPVDDDGRLAYTADLPVEQQMPAELVGKSILEKHGKSDANEGVLHELRVRHALLHQENYHHSYPHCWRSKTPIIFRAMDQWFVRVDQPVEGGTFRDRAVDEIGRVNWIPDWGVNRIKGAVQSRPDWCISRQRSWGVPIPAFYAADGTAILDARIVRNTADLVEKHGSNVWFERPAAELWKAVRPADWSGPEAATRSSDTLDVWIDSGSSSAAVIARRPELRGSGDKQPFQADMYLEGSDQHRGWFQSSLLLSLAGNGAAPYRTVLTHGFMVDADREKISKSKQGQGVYQKPQTAERYVKEYGADVLRLWVASQDFRNDIVVSEERLQKVGETYRVIRNALRYQLSNLYDFDPAKDAVADEELNVLDRWILDLFLRLRDDVVKAYETYEFHSVYQRIAQFAAVELSSRYHDTIKDRLYVEPANSRRRRSSQTALYRMATGLSQMLSPILVFTADEAWEFLPGRSEASVHLSRFVAGVTPATWTEDEEFASLWELRDQALPELERLRREKAIGKALDATLVIRGLPGFVPFERARALGAEVKEILGVSEIAFDPSGTPEKPIEFLARHADGTKCERCWHWETDVGSHAGHPTLCGRCVAAVAGSLTS